MDLAFELHDLVRTLDRWAEKMLRAEDLSYNRYVALMIASHRPGLTVRELAVSLGISEPSTSALVRKLIDAGYLANIAPAGSGNIRSLSVTAAGATKLADCSALLGNSLDDNAFRIGVDPQALAGTIRALHDEVRTIHREDAVS